MFIHEPYPGYENQYLSFASGKFFSEEELEAGRKAQFEAMTSYEIPEGMKIEDKIIPGPDEGQELKIRIISLQDFLRRRLSSWISTAAAGSAEVWILTMPDALPSP